MKSNINIYKDPQGDMRTWNQPKDTTPKSMKSNMGEKQRKRLQKGLTKLV
jgi:hypothetical protein